MQRPEALPAAQNISGTLPTCCSVLTLSSPNDRARAGTRRRRRPRTRPRRAVRAEQPRDVAPRAAALQLLQQVDGLQRRRPFGGLAATHPADGRPHRRRRHRRQLQRQTCCRSQRRSTYVLTDAVTTGAVASTRGQARLTMRAQCASRHGEWAVGASGPSARAGHRANEVLHALN